MKAILFPGQGSQIVGMGTEFYNNFDIVKKIFAEADEKLNFKLSKIILDGPDSELKLTQNTQPAILTISFSIFSVLKKEFGINFEKAGFFAGHSLGEYSALVCAESLLFDDAVHLVFERGRAMQEAVPVGEGSMLAVLNLDIKEVNDFISKLKTSGVCEVANDNATGQIIISGSANKIDELQKILKENKKKSIMLPVSAPFHCSLMKKAADQMQKKISLVNFNIPKNKIINNVLATPENNPEEIKKLLYQQIYSKVRWRESILFMKNNGVSEFIEIGPGKVLSGLVKRVIKDSNSFSINSINDIKNLNNEF
tara:strand:- start:2229 stop:3161 length:933 start_codon:yes stop_codon:yes gene_type:complete